MEPGGHGGCQHLSHPNWSIIKYLNCLFKVRSDFICCIISDFILFMCLCYHDANLQYFQFSSHHITEPGELPGSWLIWIKHSWGCWLYGIFMKFSPAYDNENISQCANIILRHDRWVDTQIQDSKSPVGTLCTLLWHSRLTNTSFCCDGTEWKD